MLSSLWPVRLRLTSAVVERKSFKVRRRHSTVGERGTGGNDVSRDVTDDAISVSVADRLLTELRVGVISDGEKGLLNVYKIIVWTRQTTPDGRPLSYALCHRQAVCFVHQHMHPVFI